MIIPDLNLLLYAYFENYPQHAAAKQWWESIVNGKDIVGIVPPVAFGFVRLATNRKIYAPPISVEDALGNIESWFLRTNVQWLVSRPANLEIAFRLLRSEGVAGSLTTDAQNSALRDRASRVALLQRPGLLALRRAQMVQSARRTCRSRAVISVRTQGGDRVEVGAEFEA